MERVTTINRDSLSSVDFMLEKIGKFKLFWKLLGQLSSQRDQTSLELFPEEQARG